MRRLLGEAETRIPGPTRLLCNNQRVIRLVHNPEFHQRTKHIDVRYYFVRDHQEKNEVDVTYVSMEIQLADIFTKPLHAPRFIKVREELGVFAVPLI